MNYWLMKSEPDAFSIDDLKKVKKEAMKILFHGKKFIKFFNVLIFNLINSFSIL